MKFQLVMQFNCRIVAHFIFLRTFETTKRIAWFWLYVAFTMFCIFFTHYHHNACWKKLKTKLNWYRKRKYIKCQSGRTQKWRHFWCPLAINYDLKHPKKTVISPAIAFLSLSSVCLKLNNLKCCHSFSLIYWVTNVFLLIICPLPL